MLIGFSVSNFKSFRETQSISFKAAKISRHKEHLVQTGNQNVLKTGLIFGANAGGKSNLIKAVYFSREIIMEGLGKMDLSKQYFRLDKECINRPGVFEYRIGIDEREYVYGIAVSYAKREIIAEWLLRIGKNGEETYLFNRDIDNDGNRVAETEVKFDRAEEKIRMNIYLNDFGKNISDTLKQKTILNDLASRSNEESGLFSEISRIFQWFARMIIIFPTSSYGGFGMIAEDRDNRNLFSLMLNYFNVGIKSVEAPKDGIRFDELLDQMPSDGTKRLFQLIPLFYESKEGTVLIDEIDRSLHTNLTRKFLELFYQLTADKKKQIIITAHDTNLLDLELVRQDELWFVESQEDQSSTVFSLNKFKERIDKRIDREYLLGRYGAIPVFTEWEKENS